MLPLGHCGLWNRVEDRDGQCGGPVAVESFNFISFQEGDFHFIVTLSLITDGSWCGSLVRRMTCIFYCIVDIETQVAKLLMFLADWRASLWRLASRWPWNTSAKQLFDVRIKWGKSFSKHYSEVFRSFPEHGLITFFVRRVFVFWIILFGHRRHNVLKAC